MPVNLTYSLTDFRSGWQEISKYKNASDPRDVSRWLGDTWTVIPPNSCETAPPDSVILGKSQLEQCSAQLEFVDTKVLKRYADQRVAYVLGLDAATPYCRLCCIVSRAYEAADCLAHQFAYECELIDDAGNVAKRLRQIHEDACYWGQDGELLLERLRTESDTTDRALKIIEEIRIEDLDTRKTRRHDIVRSLNELEKSADLLERIRRSNLSRGPKIDEAHRLLVMRLAEMFAISTSLEPAYADETAEEIASSTTGSQWLLFLRAALSAVNHSFRGNSQDHVLREIKDYFSAADMIFALARILQPKNRYELVEDPITYDRLPSEGLLYYYGCAPLFVNKSGFPPKREPK